MAEANRGSRLHPAGGRIAWVDAAKGLGISLVLYGHVTEAAAQQNASSALAQTRFIYAFHMPLFFFLAGYVWKRRDLGLGAFLARMLRGRLVPFLVFNLLGLLIWLAQLSVQHGVPADAIVARLLKSLTLMGLLGAAVWNTPMWFLVGLAMVELWQFGLDRLLDSRTPRLLISVAAFLGLSVALALLDTQIGTILGPARNAWHIGSAVHAMVFFQLGMLLRRLDWLEVRMIAGLGWPVLAAALLATTLTYQLNPGPFRAESPVPVVMLIVAGVGQPLFFLLTAVAGTAMVVSASRTLSGSALLGLLGRLTVPLFGLNGLTILAINRPAVAWLFGGKGATEDPIYTTVACLTLTLVTMTVCVPAGWLLRRHLPWTIGRAKC